MNIKNNSSDKIIVWLDDLPFCDRWIESENDRDREITENDGPYDENCGANNINNASKKGNNWAFYLKNKRTQYNYDPNSPQDIDKIIRVEIIGEDGSVIYDSVFDTDPNGLPSNFNRYQILEENQIVRVIPLTTNYINGILEEI